MSDPNLERSFRWSDIGKARKAEFAALFDTPAFKDVFNEKFAEGLERRRDLLDGRFQKGAVVQLLILGVLAMALLSLHLTVSIFGLSTADSRNLREVLLVTSSTVQLISSLRIREQMFVRELLEAYVDKLSKGNDSARRALRIRYGFVPDFSSVSKTKTLTPRHKIVVVAAGIGMIGWFLVAIVCGLLIQLAAMIDILRDPTISIGWSLLVVVYVILVDAGTLGMQAMGGSAEYENVTP